MVYTTHLWWLVGWFIIAIPTLHLHTSSLQVHHFQTNHHGCSMDVHTIELVLIWSWICFPLSRNTESTRNGMEAVKTLQWTLFQFGVYGIQTVQLGKTTQNNFTICCFWRKMTRFSIRWNEVSPEISWPSHARCHQPRSWEVGSNFTISLPLTTDICRLVGMVMGWLWDGSGGGSSHFSVLKVQD